MIKQNFVRVLFIGMFIVVFTKCTDIDDSLSNETGSQDNIEEVNDKLLTIVDDHFVDGEGKEYFTGLLIQTECYGFSSTSLESELTLTDLEIPDSLPPSYDLSEFLPPIGNQGRQGSCTAWATTYYLKSFQERIQYQDFSASQIMSPSYIYNQLTLGDCQATAIMASLELLKEKGARELPYFPYDENTCSPQPSEDDDIEAVKNKISDYKMLSGYNMVNEMKTLISTETPVILAVGLDEHFSEIDAYGLSAYREHAIDESEDETLGHTMLAVGYSDEYQAFKVVNSWGQGFGDDGFVWIDYRAFDNVFTENYTFKVICSAWIAYDAIE